MVLFPLPGRNYWLVTDIWEKFVAVPVKFCFKAGICKNYGFGDCLEYIPLRRDIYKSKTKAQRIAAARNRKVII